MLRCVTSQKNEGLNDTAPEAWYLTWTYCLFKTYQEPKNMIKKINNDDLKRLVQYSELYVLFSKYQWN
jgi:hypothetical protein